MKRHCLENIVILFVVGVLALNYPLISLFDRLVLLLSLPLLYLYVFLVWLLLIVAMAFIVEAREVRGEERSPSGYMGQPGDDEIEQ
jgi:hypothetical protein